MPPKIDNRNNAEEYLEKILLMQERILAVNEAILQKLNAASTATAGTAETIDFGALATAMQNVMTTGLTRP